MWGRNGWCDTGPGCPSKFKWIISSRGDSLSRDEGIYKKKFLSGKVFSWERGKNFANKRSKLDWKDYSDRDNSTQLM